MNWMLWYALWDNELMGVVSDDDDSDNDYSRNQLEVERVETAFELIE